MAVQRIMPWPRVEQACDWGLRCTIAGGAAISNGRSPRAGQGRAAFFPGQSGTIRWAPIVRFIGVSPEGVNRRASAARAGPGYEKWLGLARPGDRGRGRSDRSIRWGCGVQVHQGVAVTPTRRPRRRRDGGGAAADLEKGERAGPVHLQVVRLQAVTASIHPEKLSYGCANPCSARTSRCVGPG